jgi:serine phosphatase RsbU (regulator of sigma subunit)
LRYVNAGHCPGLLCHVREGSKLLEPTGPALGIFPGHQFREETVTLDEGDHLVCATDGVIDALRTDDLDARYAWMRSVVAEHAAAGAVETAQALVRGAAADAVGGHKDDLAALVLHRTT